MKRILLLGLLGVVVIAGVVALMGALFNPSVHQVAPVRQGPAIESVYATGFVEAAQRRVLRAPRAAVIDTIFDGPGQRPLREGDEVRAGQPILRLRDSTLAARRATAQVEADRLAAQLAPDSPFIKAWAGRVSEASAAATDARDREKRLARQLETRNVSLDQYEAARTAATVAEQRRDALQKDFDQAVADLGAAGKASRSALDQLDAAERDDMVVAPLDGVILRLPLKAGEFAPMGAELAMVGDLRELIIESEVNEDDISRVRFGASVMIRLAGNDTERVDGEVFEVLPDADRATKGYLVKVKFAGAKFIAQPGSQLRGSTELPGGVVPLSGMTAELGVITRRKDNALVFPRAALTPDNTVFVVRDGRAVEAKVVLGLMNFSVCEAAGGLASGDQVIITDLRALKDGARVRVKEAK